MEEVIKKLKQEFKKEQYDSKRSKLAYAIGYLEDNEELTRKEAVSIIRMIFFGTLEED